jgi:cytochrome P450
VKHKIHQALYEKTAKKSGNNERSLFHHIAASDMLQSERSEERLVKEAQVLLGAGTASTARTIGFACYYILSRGDLRSALEDELADIMKGWPDHVPAYAQLERLPLLQAIIKESLR